MLKFRSHFKKTNKTVIKFKPKSREMISLSYTSLWKHSKCGVDLLVFGVGVNKNDYGTCLSFNDSATVHGYTHAIAIPDYGSRPSLNNNTLH